jgi:hypothetical protein
LGIALKLTIEGNNQMFLLPTYVFAAVRSCNCCVHVALTRPRRSAPSLPMCCGLESVLTYFTLQVVTCCVVTQMNYLNKALDLFNAAIVSPVYYVMFTVLTIVASIVMFRVRPVSVVFAWLPAHAVLLAQDVQSWKQICTEGAGFVTIVAGTFLLHTTRDMDVTVADLTRLTKDSQTLISVSSSKEKRELEVVYTADPEAEGRGRLTAGSNRR